MDQTHHHQTMAVLPVSAQAEATAASLTFFWRASAFWPCALGSYFLVETLLQLHLPSAILFGHVQVRNGGLVASALGNSQHADAWRDEHAEVANDADVALHHAHAVDAADSTHVHTACEKKALVHMDAGQSHEDVDMRVVQVAGDADVLGSVILCGAMMSEEGVQQHAGQAVAAAESWMQERQPYFVSGQVLVLAEILMMNMG